MSITSRIRKSPVIVTTILLAFVAAYLVPYIAELSRGDFFSPSKVNVATIAGHEIPFSPQYRALYDEMLLQEVHINGQYEGIEGRVHNTVWNNLTSNYGFKSTYEALGVDVSDEESYDILLGNDIPEPIRRHPAFQDPDKRVFDKARYLNFWNSQGRHFASRYEDGRVSARKQEKLDMLIETSTHTPKLEEKKREQLKETRAVRVLYVPYATIDNSKVKDVREEDKQAYYKHHKEDFRIDPEGSSRTIEYVSLPILPDSQDKSKVMQELELLKQRFLACDVKQAEAFAKQYSDHPEEVLVQWGDASLPDYIKEKLLRLKEGESYPVIGPIAEGATVVMYKYIGIVPSNIWSLGEKERIHRFVKIEREVDTKGLSKSKMFTEASNLVREVKRTKKWKEVASEKYGFNVLEATFTLEEARRVGWGNYRKLVRWLFSDAKVGDLSAPIEVKDKFYIVAMMTKEQRAGFLTPQQVDKKIETILLNQKKAAIIKKKLLAIGLDDKSLHQIQQNYGEDAFVYDNKKLAFSDNEIVAHNISPRAVGSVFALKRVGERTTIIEGEHGVYVIELLKKDVKPEPQEAKGQKQVTDEEKAVMKEKEIVRKFVLKHHIKVHDQRYRFYD